ncbi:MAG: hypothetical protein U0175_01865 [Caldilineaceae bacterium]
MRRKLILPMILVSAGLLAACTDEVIVPTAVPIITPAANEATTTPNALIPTPLPPISDETSSTTPETSPQQQSVEDRFAADLGITFAPADSTGIEGVHAFEATVASTGTKVWVAHTVGIRSFDPLQNHMIAIYQQDSGQWKQVTQYELVDTATATGENNAASTQQVDANSAPTATQSVSPDYLGAGSVFQVTIEPERLWLQVDGGAGAHSGVFGLFSFDGTALKQEASAFSSSPGAGVVQDVNGDGIGEVVLDNSDYYVFCYACGVRNPSYTILRWDGSAMVAVEPQKLPATAPSDLTKLNDRMLQEAQAGLWKDALATLEQVKPLSKDNEPQQWNNAWVQINGDARREQAEMQGTAYPLLDQLFYGDFKSAVDAMRGYDAESIFTTQTPLIIGTVAEGNDQALSQTILTGVQGVIQLQPNDAATAPAYFLQAWAQSLLGNNADAVTALKQATTLDPEDKLFKDSLTLLNK